MIRYFRINDPYRLVGLFILLILISLPLFIDPIGMTVPELQSIVLGEKQNEGFAMYSEVVDDTAPLAAWFYELVDSLFGRSLTARHVVAFLLIFLQGTYFGIMLIVRKAFNENTYIPSFLFCLLFFFAFDTLTLSGELIGSAFLLLALNNLFKEVEFRVQRDETVFNLGLFVSLATLFSLAFYIYIFCIMVVLIFFTRATLRKFLLLIFGFLLPHLLVMSIAYVGDSLSSTVEYYYLSNLSFSRQVFFSVKGLLILSAVPLLYLAGSLVILQREARFSKYQSLILQIMFLWLATSFVYLFLCENLRPQNLIVFIPVLAYIFTHFFLFIRRRKFVEINAWLMVIGIISVNYLTRYNQIDAVNYTSFLVSPNLDYKDKRLLVLENSPDLYFHNTLATPFLNWQLSQDIFRNPDYYEHVTQVYHYFKLDPPEIVIDRENLLRPFLQRIPELEKDYQRRGNVYVRVSN